MVKSCHSGWVFSLIAASILITSASHARSTNTQSDNRPGLKLSQYEYKEPSVGVSLKATNLGIDYAGTNRVGMDGFVTIYASYEYGRANYKGSGNKNNNPNWFYEIRITGGKDFKFVNHTLSPFGGLATRYLHNDMRGFTDTNKIGYRRDSNYITLPIGIRHQMRLMGNHQLTTTLEYDYLIRGWQMTRLSDLMPDNSNGDFVGDLTNTQHTGFGLRLSSMYAVGRWAFGPHITYWSINQSDTASALGRDSSGYFLLTGYEPKNSTLNVGAKATFQF